MQVWIFGYEPRYLPGSLSDAIWVGICPHYNPWIWIQLVLIIWIRTASSPLNTTTLSFYTSSPGTTFLHMSIFKTVSLLTISFSLPMASPTHQLFPSVICFLSSFLTNSGHLGTCSIEQNVHWWCCAPLPNSSSYYCSMSGFIYPSSTQCNVVFSIF